MFKYLLRSSTNRALIEALHGAIVAAARQTAFYTQYGVADTLEGRFEMVSLHAMLALRALRHATAPGPSMASALSDAIFKGFDENLREMGVGDVTIPKRMTELAGAFLGRCSAYEAALATAGPAELEAALQRNIFAPGVGDTARLARYTVACAQALERLPIEQFAQTDAMFYDAGECK